MFSQLYPVHGIRHVDLKQTNERLLGGLHEARYRFDAVQRALQKSCQQQEPIAGYN